MKIPDVEVRLEIEQLLLDEGFDIEEDSPATLPVDKVDEAVVPATTPPAKPKKKAPEVNSVDPEELAIAAARRRIERDRYTRDPAKVLLRADEEVGLALSEVELGELSGSEDTHDVAVLLDSLEVSLDGLLGLVVLLVALGVLGEGLLLGVLPVLVEATSELIGEVLCVDGGESAEASGGLDVTDQTDDLKAMSVPTLILQGDDDQVVPYKDASLLQAKLVQHGTLKIYPGYPHGMLTTHADVINPDLLAFVKG
jgi:hypothetical protein